MATVVRRGFKAIDSRCGYRGALHRVLATSVLALLALACGGEPRTEVGPSPQRATVIVDSITVVSTERQPADGYRYTITVRFSETAGVSVTVNSVDVGLSNGSEVFAVATFEEPLGESARTLSAYSSVITQRLVTIDDDGSHPYASAIRVTVKFVDVRGNTGVTSNSATVPPLVTTPPPPPPSPTPTPSPAPVPSPPPSQPVTNTLAFDMGNACSEPINLRFFDRAHDWVWPDASSRYTLGAGSSSTYRLNCTMGASICYGASTTDARLYWGVGVDGNRSCENCCYICSNTSVAPPRLSCGSAPPPQTVPLPSLQCRPIASGTTVTIENRSAHTFTVTFEGPSRGSLTYAPGATHTTSISPGTYTLTATAPGVIPATRTQGLTGTCDYQLVITVVSA